MTLADYYSEIRIGGADPVVMRLAETLQKFADALNLEYPEPVQQDPALVGRYCSLTVAENIQFFSADLQMSDLFSTKGTMPAGIWAGSIFSGKWRTRFDGCEINFPSNGLPQMVSVGQPTTYFDEPGSTKRLRMASFLIAETFFEQVAPDDPHGQLAKLRAYMQPGVHVRPLSQSNVLTEAFLKLLNHPYDGPTARLYIESLVMTSVFELAAFICQDSPISAAVPEQQSDLGLMARSLIDEAPEKFDSVAALARRLGTNQTTLRKEFKAAVGATIFDYVLTRRMQAAQLLLRDGRLQISEISRQVGYGSSASFSTAYKRFFGCSPGEDRGA